MSAMKAIAGWVLAAWAVTLMTVSGPVAAQEPTAAEIVEKNAAARGGAEAWRKLQSMVWTGHVESSTAAGRKMPFLLEQKRPHSTRFELISEGQKSIRIFDGSHGWKLRPGSGGMPEMQPYSEDELKFARGAQVIDGPLMDYSLRGAVITLGGSEIVDGRRAYVLNVQLPSGGNHRVWVDAETFLEFRHDREVRSASGRPSTVTVFFRDYRTFEGLQIPISIETGAGPGKPMNKLVIDRVALDPPLDDKMFAKPVVPITRRNGVAVDTRSAAAPGTPSRPLPH